MIKLTRVSKTFDGGRSYAVKNLSLSVDRGKTLVLLGSSGCGKTTTLKMINRLIEPTKGIIEVGGKDVMDHNPVDLRRQIGYVFQEIGLFPHMTIEQNVEIVPRLLGWPIHSRRERMQELLNLVGLPAESFAQRFPDELSGGQQQRVAVARAIVSQPALILADEPTANLDTVTSSQLMDLFVELNQNHHVTFVIATHDIRVMKYARRLVRMEDGKIISDDMQLQTQQQVLTSD